MERVGGQILKFPGKIVKVLSFRWLMDFTWSVCCLFCEVLGQHFFNPRARSLAFESAYRRGPRAGEVCGDIVDSCFVKKLWLYFPSW